MSIGNIVLRTNLESMPQSCKECRFASKGFSTLYMQQAGYPEILEAFCIYGMDVYPNVKSNTYYFYKDGIKISVKIEKEQ